MLDWLLESLFPALHHPRLLGDGALPWVDPESADECGLVGVGGDLDPEQLLSAYRHGVFPMFEEGEPVCWWSPDPRAMFDLDGLHVSRRLARTVESGRFRVTFDQEFVGVMRGCADRTEGTWVTSEMIEAYHRLHELGHAHSTEVWQEGELVGGVYGVTIGGLFAGESMFHRVSDASKVGLVHLFQRLNSCGYVLFDTQILNEHTRRLGAYAIPRSEYLSRLREAIEVPVDFN
jgi:leucyl/phenylalanyl-tRNA--protein transferase